MRGRMWDSLLGRGSLMYNLTEREGETETEMGGKKEGKERRKG